MKFGIIIALGALALGTSAFAQTQNQYIPVNLTVDKYAFAYFPVGPQDGVKYVYGAVEANNQAAFDLEVMPGETGATDTVNMVWGCNTAATITVALDKGNLPGDWTMAFDGAGLTGTNQQFNTESADVGALLAVPVTLNVANIGLSTAAKSYAGQLNIVSALPL